MISIYPFYSFATAWKEAWNPGLWGAEAFPLEFPSHVFWCGCGREELNWIHFKASSQWIGGRRHWKNYFQTRNYFKPLQGEGTGWFAGNLSWVWEANWETPKTRFNRRHWKSWHHPPGGCVGCLPSEASEWQGSATCMENTEDLTLASRWGPSKLILLSLLPSLISNPNLSNPEERERERARNV